MKSNSPWFHCAPRVIAAFAFSVGALVGSSAWAMPPHPHDQGKLEFPNPRPVTLLNHSHVGGIPVREVNPGTFGPGPHLVDDNAVAASQTWRTYSTWDNRTYRNGDVAAGQPYAHGFIEPTDATRPRYLFEPSVPVANLAAIRAAFTSIWQSWRNAAQAEGQNTRTTPDGTRLVTALSFRESLAGDTGGKEIDVLFDNPPSFGVWSPTAQTLRFQTTPTVNVFVSNGSGAANTAGWQVSNNNGVTFGPSVSIALPWNFTSGAPTNAGVPNGGDLDYKCVNVAGCGGGSVDGQIFEGNEGTFPALTIADSAGGAQIPATNTPIVQADFISVALHEWGHIIGLDHVTPALYAF